MASGKRKAARKAAKRRKQRKAEAEERSEAEARRDRHQSLAEEPGELIATATVPGLPTYLEPDRAAEYLTSLSALREVDAYKRLSYELLDLGPGLAVLDVGCGAGRDVRAIAPQVAPGGRVVGVDADAAMIEMALASDHPPPTGAAVEFVVADAEHMPFGGATFDRVRIDRTLQHVADPHLILREIQRVLRPAGCVVVVEPDWKMMAIYPGSPAGGDDDHVVAEILGWQAAQLRHPLIGRQLRALLKDADFRDIQVDAVTYTTERFAPVDLVLELSAAAERAATGRVPHLTPDDVQSWIEAARAADAEGRFFASVPLIFARGFAREAL